jgi:putative phosphoribosyl transferase
MLFKDRREAGVRLADQLMKYKGRNPIVLALPRGGVVVGYEVASALEAPLDVIVVRKLGAPGRPELGVGAVAPGGIWVINEQLVRLLDLTEDDIAEIAAAEEKEMERRLRRYRGTARMPDLRGRTVILVDDGLATGATAQAAIEFIRRQAPRRLVFAAPVCAPDTAEALRAEVGDLVCTEMPSDFMAVGVWYRNFEQVSDEEVVMLLERARRERSRAQSKGAASSKKEELLRVLIPVGMAALEGELGIPEGAHGLVLFAHGSGSGRKSPRNRFVAESLRNAGLATLLIDLLTRDEEEADLQTGAFRFDIGLLSGRLLDATDWLSQSPETANFSIGYFGASTGAAAALVAAAQRQSHVGAVVSRGGRPDLAGEALTFVRAPTLLIVGGKDTEVIQLNQEAFNQLNVEKRLEIIPGATHLFEEPGALEEVARLAADWFVGHLGKKVQPKAA